MKNKLELLVLIVCFGIIQLAIAISPAPVGSQFNYQGELYDSNVLANGPHDFVIDLYNYPNGVGILKTLIIDNILVTDGLFNLDLDFGALDFNGDEIWMEIAVRNSSTAPNGAYSSLSPRQRINAVPYALKAQTVTSQNASTGDVYYFDGTDWTAQAFSSLSKWKGGTFVTEFDLYYTAGQVGIGTNNPTADLEINGLNGGDVFRARVSGNTKLLLRDNGGVSIGAFATAPTDGLLVEGDVKQNSTSNGLMKFMAFIECGSVGGSSVIRQYNGTTTDGIITAVTTNIDPVDFDTCVVTFPIDVNTRFWQVSVVGSTNYISAHCDLTSFNSQLRCYRFNTNTKTKAPGNMMIFVY